MVHLALVGWNWWTWPRAEPELEQMETASIVSGILFWVVSVDWVKLEAEFKENIDYGNNTNKKEVVWKIFTYEIQFSRGNS